MRFAIQALIIGLILFLITRMQILIVEVTWLRRYILRLLTEEMNSSKAAPLVDPPLVVTPLEPILPSEVTVSSDTVVATLLQGMQHIPLGEKDTPISVEEILDSTSEASVELEDYMTTKPEPVDSSDDDEAAPE